MREHNDLPAERYVPVADLEIDVELRDRLLGALEQAGIAAYLEGAADDGRVLRLHVDPDHVPQARETVSAQVPQTAVTFLAEPGPVQLAEDEVDAAWNRIVAGFSESTDEPASQGPSGLSSRLVRHEPIPWRGPLDADLTDDPGDLADDPDDHYIPPEPPPIPPVHPITRLAWAGIIGGPAFVLLVAVLGLQLEPWVIVLALIAFCGGVATLVARMADRPRQDDGWDDGAVV